MGRNNPIMKKDDEAKYRLRAGIAQAALLHKHIRPMHDSGMRPLREAEGYAKAYSDKELVRMSKQRSPRVIVSF